LTSNLDPEVQAIVDQDAAGMREIFEEVNVDLANPDVLHALRTFLDICNGWTTDECPDCGGSLLTDEEIASQVYEFLAAGFECLQDRVVLPELG